MNAAQRTMLAVYSLLWVAACCGLIILAWNDTQKLDITFGQFNAQAFITAPGATRWAFTALMAAFALPALLTFSYALTWQRPARPGFLRTMLPGHEEGEVPAQDVARMIEAEIASYPEVKEANVALQMRRGGVESRIGVLIDPETGHGRMEAIAIEMTELVLREQLGATPLRPPRVAITLDVLPPPPPVPVLTSAIEGPDEPRVPFIDWDGDGGAARHGQAFVRPGATRPVRRFEAGYHRDD